MFSFKPAPIKTPENNELIMKIISLGSVLFLIFLADATLSFWVPNFLEQTFGNTTKVGLVISTSSLIGLIADLVIPQMLRGITVRKLTVSSIILSMIFSVFLFSATVSPYLITILLAMTTWGIYYEFLGFAQQQFVADSTPLKFHAVAWGLLGVFKSLAYFLGPLIGDWLYPENLQSVLYTAFALLILSLLILTATMKKHKRKLDIQIREVSLIRELSHWKELFVHVWPVVFISLFLGLVDANFWTLGPIITQQLSEESFFGGWLLSIYIFPSLFMGFVVARMGIYKGKKKIAQKFMLMAGLTLSLFSLFDSISWMLCIVFITSMLLAVVYPMTDAVYSDIVQRMGKEREHLIGLSSSTRSVAYIVGPAFAGSIADYLGFYKSFSTLGIIVAIVALVLLLNTPKKILLPQKEIKRWKD